MVYIRSQISIKSLRKQTRRSVQDLLTIYSFLEIPQTLKEVNERLMRDLYIYYHLKTNKEIP